jgi:hypothetical protein
MERRSDRPDIRSWIGSLIILLAAVLPAAGGEKEESAGETFYLVVFAAQEEDYHPETSHCFATFARIAESQEAEPVVELHHINWFSRRGHRTGATHAVIGDDGMPTRPEPGENRTTREALLLASRRGLKITRWGPFEIARELHERAMQHIDLLEGRVPGRRVLYKSFDIGCRESEEIVALNCVHAVSDVDRDGGPLRTWTSYGEQAARIVVQHLGRWFKEPGRDHPEAWERIWRETWRPGPAPLLRIAQGRSPFRRDTTTSGVQARTKTEGAAGPQSGQDDSSIRGEKPQEGGN